MKTFLIMTVFFAFVASVMGVKDEICRLPAAVDGANGIYCLAAIPSYSYVGGANKCIHFVYGGCGGNANRFNTEQECEAKCKE